MEMRGHSPEKATREKVALGLCFASHLKIFYYYLLYYLILLSKIQVTYRKASIVTTSDEDARRPRGRASSSFQQNTRIYFLSFLCSTDKIATAVSEENQPLQYGCNAV
ncbi:hypothetical protein EGR_04975 [Echinococcus granulosus]|uniref:Uncharacterized protein n=1 Tax=Echinococcus granulosus TaxID=6210 RepID=W6UPB6_ECHGR|nr:hypothetical protein EGR_04975 [Echinococcus granulosus]EUB60122.1 hypothetical protein EGR_04975 [Echinococcus granulosus]